MELKKSKQKWKWKDELLTLRFALSFFISWIWTAAMAAVGTVLIHEPLHMLGAVIEGGTIKEVALFNPQAWVNTFFYPLVYAGPIGHVTASIPTTGLIHSLFPPELIFVFLPYIVMFPVSLIMIAGDNAGISNKWRLIGAPMLYFSFVSFFADYAVYVGTEPTPPPAWLLKIIYLGIIVAGFVGTVIHQSLKTC